MTNSVNGLGCHTNLSELLSLWGIVQRKIVDGNFQGVTKMTKV